MGIIAIAACFGVIADAAPPAYDPLAVGAAEPVVVDLSVHDAERQREIPLRVYLPVNAEGADENADAMPRPVVLFSHGLGGSRENNPYLGEHWAKRGYVAVFMQHLGSDESVWKDVPVGQRLREMQKAASGKNARLRRGDVVAVIDALEAWNADPASPLMDRLDLDHIGMSGHSFGAVTTQAVSGQRPGWGREVWGDPRIKAAVAMSPSVQRGVNADRAFSEVTMPWLLMTGTLDVAIIGDADVEARLAVYPALPAGDKYELVLDRAQHSAFGDRALPSDREPRNPNHYRVILALSTAFWDAYLRDDPAAKAWLRGDGAEGVLEPGDRWQHK
ncbi:alpha/beta hydrolase family protein [Algisphaera agarilytica]|uniref:Putative dienelactone hydrolase n=1 Tax=Algisphaera agarilytica TaxID=1385975 RepID=A0A7X0LLD0_9BACT|nr:hypothetical protein [Algisphaera agarilytica]MBB6430501.1 putative dienelactone hydrolase [Algisphaera agarilytica]